MHHLNNLLSKEGVIIEMYQELQSSGESSRKNKRQLQQEHLAQSLST